ncbi:MAG: hypothetical protein JSR19_03785 [Proteobacteria bacterium]|nr:hypothetical protein [Pseudomonadota bacterium]HQR03414.1 histidine kinase [Rhodocyclaceae bacterium]
MVTVQKIPMGSAETVAPHGNTTGSQDALSSFNVSVTGNAIDGHSISLLRCMIAVTILLTSLPSGSSSISLIKWTFGSFLAYCLYAFTVALISYIREWPSTPRIVYWLDVVFIGCLVTITYASDTILYQCFFYPIFVASFAKEFREGVIVSIASFLITTCIGIGFAFSGDTFGIGHGNMLIEADYVLVIGCIIAYCGGYGGMFMRKLALLKEMNKLWHPRIGVDQMYSNNLDCLLEFFDGDMCSLVLQRQSPELSYTLYTAYRNKAGHAMVQHNIAASAAGTLLTSLPPTSAVFFHHPEGSPWRRIKGYLSFDIYTWQKTRPQRAQCETLANLLDTKIFASVPFVQHGTTTGRIFLTASHGGFNVSDLDFLSHASNTMSTVIESMQLVEELVNKATEQERSSISRDLHDTTIQPYIGLKLALEAINRETPEDNPLTLRIRELIEMTEMTVRDLRDFAATIKGKEAVPGEAMIAAIRTHAERLKRFYGIHVEINVEISKRLNGRLAAEAFQIFSEGLSNILRHTQAKNAVLSISCEGPDLLLKIGNDQGSNKHFMPRSISQRTQALGGKTFVEHHEDHYTYVISIIPM